MFGVCISKFYSGREITMHKIKADNKDLISGPKEMEEIKLGLIIKGARVYKTRIRISLFGVFTGKRKDAKLLNARSSKDIVTSSIGQAILLIISPKGARIIQGATTTTRLDARWLTFLPKPS